MNQTINERLEALEAENKRLNSRNNNAAWRYRIFSGVAVVAIIAATMVVQSPPAVAQGGNPLAARVTALEIAVVALQTKTQFVSVAGGKMTISGTNLHIVNGMGSTATTNGLGNLIVGYDSLRGGGWDVRTGSHNIVVGLFNNYDSFGGLVVGQNNSIFGDYCSVSGGTNNTASGEYASVSGGAYNTASGNHSSVSGGNTNTASGFGSSGSGGFSNVASGAGSSVSGGGYNTASSAGINAGMSISGGLSITQSANWGWSAGSIGVTTYTGKFRSD